MQQHVLATSAKSLSNADFTSALRDRNQHDVHDDNAANHQRDAGNPDGRDEECLTETSPDAEQAGIGFNVEAIFAPGRIVTLGAEGGAGFIDCLVERNACTFGLSGDSNAVIVRSILFEI